MLIRRLRRVEAEELSELAAVLSVLVDTELQVLVECLIELLLVLGNLCEDVHALLDNILPKDLEDFVLLERLAGDVEWKVLRIDDSFDQVNVLGDEVLAVIDDKDMANVELDVVLFIFGLEEVEGGAVNIS